ncbi:receptor-like protein Cf-9 homolog [Nicotiana sylvestris]|uniref:receptor-like protein Cf-9 homolog n=1 Tax=Nicotiana sylvestris TaxID=4096 RepID=UPI00388C3A6D
MKLAKTCFLLILTSLVPQRSSSCSSTIQTYLLLSQNNLSGQIASTICNLKTVQLLDLGSNNLQGTIPECLGEMDRTYVLDLSNNNFSGTIQANFSIGNRFRVIKLHGNKLEGKVPRSLINCKYLELLDLGNNELNDTFPKWLGILSNLKILNLRSNKLHGSIRASRNENLFAQLQIMDLSSNEFSGNLPANLFENFQAMKRIDENRTTPRFVGDEFDSVTITTKGLDLVKFQVLLEISSDFVLDTFGNSSYQENVGLRGFPLSRGCGDDGVTEATTPVVLDQGEDEDSSMISWQADGCRIGTQNRYKNEKTQEKILVCRGFKSNKLLEMQI